jgi:uncharacterized membrane protein YqaE (UPF0057 family)
MRASPRGSTHAPHNQETPTMADVNENKLLLVIIAIFIPPLAVGLKEGIGGTLILNIVLTLLFWIPGFLHALYVILK